VNATPEPHLGDLANVSAAGDGAMRARTASQPASDGAATNEAPVGGIPGFRGRASRVSFLTHLGISVTVPAIAVALALDPLHDLFETQRSTALVLASVVALVAMLWQIAAMIRRAHDLNRSGWLVLIMLIPGVNVLLLTYLALWTGAETHNRFGAPPKNGLLLWLAYIALVLIPLGLAPTALLQYDDYLQDRRMSQPAQ